MTNIDDLGGVMVFKEFDILPAISNDFAVTAQKVYEASLQRKDHITKAMEYLEESENAGEQLLDLLRSGSTSSIELRDRHNAVLNVCRILNTNVDHQLALIETIADLNEEESRVINALYLAELERSNKGLKAALINVVAYLEEIVRLSNEMILMDKLVSNAKKYQKRRVEELKRLTLKAFDDAQNAIEGSQGNQICGEGLRADMLNIPLLADNEDIESIRQIKKQVVEGAERAVGVNRSSRSHFEFAENVNTYMRQLHDESLHIQKLVFKKHQIFEQNLELVSEVAGLVSVHFFGYLAIKDLIEYVLEKENFFRSKLIEKVYDLVAYMEAACDDIDYVTHLNYDLTGNISLNSRIEEEMVELTKKETGAFENTKQQVVLMTEKTRFPIDGSAKNIENARKVTEILDMVMSRFTDN